MTMKQSEIKTNNISNCMSLLCSQIVVALHHLIAAAPSPVLAADNNSSDPVNCVGRLPSDPQWIPFDIGTNASLPNSQVIVRVP